MPKCSNCHKSLDDSINFCPYCGTRIIRQVEKECPLCNIRYKDSDIMFCGHCGSRLTIHTSRVKNENTYQQNGINSLDDLVFSLNSISSKINRNSEKISYKELISFSNIDDKTRYKTFYIHKKRKGQYRMVSSPTPRLKFILRCLNELLSGFYNPKSYVTGFVRNMSIVDNGKIHVRQRYIYTIDLANFFESVKLETIEAYLHQSPFNFNNEIARTIALISCVINVKNNSICLAQGSPLSPLLSNIACIDLDKKLNGLASFYHAKYSRYADDITFSSHENITHKSKEFIQSLKKIIESYHFKINYSKVRTFGPQACHYVTGIVTNERTNIPRPYIRNIRNLLYIWEKYGIKEAYKQFDKFYQKKNKGRSTPFIGDSLRGQIEHLGLVRGKDDPIYIRFKMKFKQLTSFPFKPFCGQYDYSTHRFGWVEFNLSRPIIKNGQKYYTAKHCDKIVLISPKLNEYIESNIDSYPQKKLAQNCAYYKIFDSDGVKVIMTTKI